MPLVTTTEMFKKAYSDGYAIGAFNVNNMGLGIFSVLGADAAVQYGHGGNLFLTVFVGVVTGVGGGVMRDLFAGRTPVIMGLGL